MGLLRSPRLPTARRSRLWKLLNEHAERWIEPDLVGGWMVSLFVSARAKRIRRDLPRLLRALESQCIRELRPEYSQQTEAALARDLGIASLYQGGTDYPGSIYTTLVLTPERSGGMVPSSGDVLARWVSDFLHREDTEDVRGKLLRSGADERHAVLILPGFATVDFPVIDLLMRDEAPLPSTPPNLPAGVTHVWVMSTWSSGHGVRWSPDAGWSSFDKHVRTAA